MRFLSTLLASILGTLIAFGVVLLIGFVFLLALVASADTTPSVRTGSVLRFELSGTIPERASDDPFAQLVSGEKPFDLRDVRLALRKAAADDRISAVLLQPSGLAAGWPTLEEIRGALEAFKSSGKPLVAYAKPDGFSEADYFLASAADTIYAPPEAGFELNGFVFTVAFYREMLERLGIEPQVARAGTYKSAVEPFTRTDLSPENEEQLRALLAAHHGVFLDAISRSRNVPRARLETLAADSVLFDAQEALRAGLVDELLYEDELLDRLKARTGREEDERLREISLRRYVRVPASKAGLDEGGDEEIALLYAEGAIMSGESGYSPNPLFGGTVVGAETFVEALREARRDDDVKAIVIRVNSPGGSGTASDVMWREVRLAAAEKPLIVSMGDYAASGGYYIAAPADTIVADPLTLTGSIGVFSLFFDMGGLFERKLGITFDEVKTGPYADMLSGLRPLTPAEQAIMAREAEEFYRAFLARVAEGRGLSVAAVDSVAQGRVWTGLQAQRIGLVDVLGDLDTAIRLAAEKAGIAEGDYRIRTLPRQKTFIERFGQSLEARAATWLLHRRLSEAERRLLEHVRLLEHAESLNGSLQARLPWRLEIR